MVLRLGIIITKRTFTTTLRPCAQQVKTPRRHTKESRPVDPPYPYGSNRWFKQADSGLYGGALIQFGNKISDGKTKAKTRRKWYPNIRHEKVWSSALNQWLNLKVRHRVLRTIKKVGGLDEYLLGEKPARIKELGLFGWRLRCRIMRRPLIAHRLSKERSKLGLPKPVDSFKEFLRQEQVEEEARERREKIEESQKKRTVQDEALALLPQKSFEPTGERVELDDREVDELRSR